VTSDERPAAGSRRGIALAAFVAASLGLGWLAASADPGSDRPSFAPIFELAGRGTQVADRAVAQGLAITADDERALGEALARQYSDTDPRTPWVRAVFARLAPLGSKPFDYRVFVVDSGAPNAMALPGGVLLVTTGLLDLLQSEAELAAVLAHELGHVELSHCLDAAKFEILQRKLRVGPLVDVAALVHGALLQHTYSQAAEAEADAYAFRALTDASVWDPTGVGLAFQRLAEDAPAHRGGLFRDYLASHPPIHQRAAEYRERARAWWAAHPEATRWRAEVAWRERRAFDPGDPGGDAPVRAFAWPVP